MRSPAVILYYLLIFVIGWALCVLIVILSFGHKNVYKKAATIIQMLISLCDYSAYCTLHMKLV